MIKTGQYRLFLGQKLTEKLSQIVKLRKNYGVLGFT